MRKRKINAACLEYNYRTPKGIEYDCEYEYSGDISCTDCKYGNFGGKLDPRLRWGTGEDEENE